ncbi:hypothetical protein [Kutzneria buriramensis]|uniref:Uncharacterized protein n=1 Tax=Kutzneria buriramensis TaxID=1045776 RepID=A0A3E0GW58_9PSEU|nr:hypothetical protein [Kutzneria buriramensis]REH31098.1 hypothetical protein BCF44_122121 [Kutzneria buriramensis]
MPEQPPPYVPLGDVVRQLDYVCAIAPSDHDRGRKPTKRAPLAVIEQRLAELALARLHLGLPFPAPTVLCTLGQDPLEYWSATVNDGDATCADLGRLWRCHLGHGLTVVSAGSKGREQARTAMTAFVAMPALLSRFTLRILVNGPEWGTQLYMKNLAADLSVLRPLWGLPAHDPHSMVPLSRRLLVEVVHGQQSGNMARTFVNDLLRQAGLSAPAMLATAADTAKVRFVTTSRTPAAGKETALSQWRYGIRPDGTLFAVVAGGIHSLLTPGGEPRTWRAPATQNFHAAEAGRAFGRV